MPIFSFLQYISRHIPLWIVAVFLVSLSVAYYFVRLDSALTTFYVLTTNEQVQFLNLLMEEHDFAFVENFVKEAYPEQPPDKHPLAHKVGELAVVEHGLNAFAFCDDFLAFGCFHGAALFAVRYYGPSHQTIVDALWEGCKRHLTDPSRCLHGLGHAVMVTSHYDLLKAYQECDRLLSVDDAFWCHDGASMENINRSTFPTTAEMYGDTNDIYYPCNTVPQRYEAACVRNHISFLAQTALLTPDDQIAYCVTFANSTTQRECINMIGSLQAGIFFTEPDRIKTVCQKARHHFQSCIFGGVARFVMAGQDDRAEYLCATLQESQGRENCRGRIYNQ